LFTRLEVIQHFIFRLFVSSCIQINCSITKSLFPSDSIDINNNEQISKLPRHINRHYTSIKSNISQHLKQIVTSFENIPDRIPSNHHHIKQFRHEFIRKWTDDARNIYAQNHIIHSSNTNSDQMTDIDLKKKDRHHRHHIASSSSSNSTTNLSSIIENQSNIKQKTTSSNNSAIVYLKSKRSNDNLECKIS
jgi:hypothetical protein